MSNQVVNIKLQNGLGDKLLDLIGSYVICKHLGFTLNALFLNSCVGMYDLRLFQFHDVLINSDENKNQKYLYSPNPSASTSPYKVFQFIRQYKPEITFDQISNDYKTYSKEIIKPSEIILQKIPKDMEQAYGIHLRKSDKVHDGGDIRHISTLHEFQIITGKLLEDIETIIKTENNPSFLVVSEENEWKKEIQNKMLNYANQFNKQIHLIEIDYGNMSEEYSNFNSIMDMFCLSKCKEILEGVKYSSFSILASLLSENNLRMYANYTESYNQNIIHLWSSVIRINESYKLYDKKIHDEIANGVVDICIISDAATAL
jgi:hypothetical protein